MADTPETTDTATPKPRTPRRRAAPKAASTAPKTTRKAPAAKAAAPAPVPTAATTPKPKAPPKPRTTKRSTPRAATKTTKAKDTAKSAAKSATDKVGGGWGVAAIAGGLVAAAGAAAVFGLRGSTPRKPVDPKGGAHQADGTDSSKSFEAGIADEGSIPN